MTMKQAGEPLTRCASALRQSVDPSECVVVTAKDIHGKPRGCGGLWLIERQSCTFPPVPPQRAEHKIHSA